MPRLNSLATLGLTLIVAGIVSACGGGATQSATAAASGASVPSLSTETAAATAAAGGAPDACTLLALADVSTFLGEPAASPEAGLNVTGSDESDCDWQQADTSSGVLHLLQLQVFNSPKYLRRSGYKPSEITGDLAIPGASEAFVLNEGQGIGINMLIGGNRAVLHFSAGAKADPKASLPALTVLATKLAAKLPH